MLTVNRHIVIGRAERPAQIRSSAWGPFATFRLVTTDEQARVSRVQRHQVVAFGELVEECKDIARGDLVYAAGPVRPRRYAGQLSEGRYVREVRADRVQLLACSDVVDALIEDMKHRPQQA